MRAFKQARQPHTCLMLAHECSGQISEPWVARVQVEVRRGKRAKVLAVRTHFACTHGHHTRAQLCKAKAFCAYASGTTALLFIYVITFIYEREICNLSEREIYISSVQ